MHNEQWISILYYKENRKAPRNSELYQLLPYGGNNVWMKLKDMPLSEFPVLWRKYIQNLNGIEATEGGNEILETLPVQELSYQGKWMIIKALRVLKNIWIWCMERNWILQNLNLDH